MSEKRFLNFILTEGILLSILGITMLILPKITSLTLGIMLCITLMIYGGYKAINAFLTRNYLRHYILNILLGVLIFVLGLILFMSPMFNLIILTGLIGIYFLMESISSTAFGVQNRKTLYFWWANIFVGIIQFLLGLIIILGLPSTSIWVIGTLVGINFLISGMIMISMFISTKYIYN